VVTCACVSCPQSAKVYSTLKSTSTRFREANPDILLRKALQRISYDVDQGAHSSPTVFTCWAVPPPPPHTHASVTAHSIRLDAPVSWFLGVFVL
jgi:hypothetical protein